MQQRSTFPKENSINRIRLEFKVITTENVVYSTQSVLIESDWNLKKNHGYYNSVLPEKVLIESDWNLKKGMKKCFAR